MKLFILLPVLFLTTHPVFSQPPKTSQLPGTWQVVADQQVDRSGKVIMEDTSVTGLLIYTPEGKMSVQICWRGRRQSMMTDSVMDRDGNSVGLGLGANTWTSEQRGAIIDTYDAYFGDYIIDWQNHIVTHIVTANLRPEKGGIIYKRRFQLIGDTLYLRSTDAKMIWQVKAVSVSRGLSH